MDLEGGFAFTTSCLDPGSVVYQEERRIWMLVLKGGMDIAEDAMLQWLGC